MDKPCRCESDSVCQPCLDDWRTKAAQEHLTTAAMWRALAGIQHTRGNRAAVFDNLHRAAVADARWRDLHGYSFDADSAWG